MIKDSTGAGFIEGEKCANCARLQSECDRLRSVLAEAKQELMGWHMMGDPRPYPQCEEPYDWSRVDEYYDDLEERWQSKYV